MAPRFDPDELTLELSMADLIDTAQLRSLGFVSRGGYERLWVGQAIHSRYQDAAEAADPSYRREVALAVELVHRGWRVTVRGRADGLRRDDDGALVVEEIKSVRRGSTLSAAARAVYERQALIYAWMLRAAGEPAVRSELVLIEIGGGTVEHEPLEGDLDELEVSIKRRFTRLLRELQVDLERRAERREAARELRFPHPALRPGQERIVEAVEAALVEREHLLLEAPTGIGKTVAALYPAVRFALANEKKVFVLTAKNLQQEMATGVLELLNLDDSFHSLRLNAKARMCANDELICHEEYCPYARDYFMKLHSTAVIERLLESGGTLLPERIFEMARAAEVCPFEVSLEASGRSQVVVGDYNYAFDPYVALRDFGAEEDLSDTILIIDEIHNLVGRGRGYYSPELSSRDARRAAASIAALGEPVHRRCAGLLETLARVIEATVAGTLDDAGPSTQAALATLPEDELWTLRAELDDLFIDYLEHQRDTRSFRPDDPFVDLYYKVLRFLDVLALSAGAAFDRCVESRPGDQRLRILCKDPSRFIGAVLRRSHSVIGLSATLSPASFYVDLLGFDPERTAEVSIGSPFPRENRRIVIDPSVATVWRERPRNYARIAERIASYAEATPGNCMVLLPSYQFLREIAERLEVRGKIVLVQQGDEAPAERQAILDAMRSALTGDVLLLAVAGGVFAEGVDYPGDMLSSVAVVGPCLPALSLEQTRLKEYYDDRFERGFEYSYVVPGMTRVVQAVGRLIRSPEDRGVIALLDHRFLEPPYRDHLPSDWLTVEGPDALIGDPAEVAREFFAAAAASPGAKVP
jgi:DNA excision repair protein ERCC-2